MAWFSFTADDYLEGLQKLRDCADDTYDHAASLAINAAGTGYVVGEIVTVTGGTAVQSMTAQGIVTSVGGSGDVTGLRIESSGVYSSNPGTTAVATTASASGTGLTVDLTYADNTWTVELDEVVDTTERQLVLTSTVGSVTPTIGIKTFSNHLSFDGFDTVYNWGLVGMDSYDSGLDFYEQPNISQGFDGITGLVEVNGAFVPLKDNDGIPMKFWVSITNRRIYGAVRIADAINTHYGSFYLGLLNQFGTAAEFPYPLYIGGCSPNRQCHFADTEYGRINGLTIAISDPTDGGQYFRQSDGVWKRVVNRSGNVSTATSYSGGGVGTDDYTIYPAGVPDVVIQNLVPNNAGAHFRWETDIFPVASGVGAGSADYQFVATPGSSGDARPLFPATLLSTEASSPTEIVGELDGIFWFSPAGAAPAITAENVAVIGSDTYRVFNNGNGTNDFDWMMLKQE